MKPWPIKDFNGGMVDEFDECQPRFCQRMRNLLLDASGNPYQRNGTVAWGPQTSTKEPITGIKIVRDVTNVDDLNRFTAFLYSHHKIWASTGGSVSESTGPSALTEVTGFGTGYSIAPNVSASTRAKMQFANNHLYLSFQNRDSYNSTLLHPKPRAVHPNGYTADARFARNVGLPSCALNNAPTITYGAGAQNYVYYFIYRFAYVINGVSFDIFSAPSDPVPISSAATISGAGSDPVFTNLVWPNAATYNDLYPLVGSFTLAIVAYRTATNQTVPKFAGQAFYNSTTLTDHTTDAGLGAPLYTNDGTQAYDEPKPCKLYHVVGDYGYFGGFDITSTANNPVFPNGFMGAIQSSPGVVESAPGANTIATPDHLTAIEAVDYYPIFFTRYTCWRVEGQIDSYGTGTPTLRAISEKVGALHQSLVWKMDRGLGFCAHDGVYFTDGFSVKKLTDHTSRYYRQWFNGLTQADVDMGSGAWYQSRKKMFVAGKLAAVVSTGAPNTVHAGDLVHQTDEGGAALSELMGQPTSTVLGYSFFPTALEVFQNTLLMGDYQGQVQAMLIEPAVAADVVTTDIGVDTTSAATWITYPIVWDWISPAIDFGTRFMKKWVARMTATFKFRFPQTQVAVAITSYNDGGFQSDALNNGAALNTVQDTVPNTQRSWTVLRKMPKAHVRCMLKQIRLQKALVIVQSSKPGGSQTFPKGTLNQAAKTLTVTGAPFVVANVTAQTLYLSSDEYVQGYFISAATTGVLTVLDPGGHLPVNGSYDWQISGYPKDQTIGLNTVALAYDELTPGTEAEFNPSQTGANT